ncbi:MAG: hypothetical protein AMJ53_11300 [Gammaproteobacteria bacterium SG8_11]|nr:MAG: hypothetical protein AMJ53_11300 [Gammaproteobacteria bacterium SG8_11]
MRFTLGRSIGQTIVIETAKMKKAIQAVFDTYYKKLVEEKLIVAPEYNLVFGDRVVDITSIFSEIEREVDSMALGLDDRADAAQLRGMMKSVIGNWLAQIIHYTKPDGFLIYATGWAPVNLDDYMEKHARGKVGMVRDLPLSERKALCMYQLQTREPENDVTHVEQVELNDDASFKGFTALEHIDGENRMEGNFSDLFNLDSDKRPQTSFNMRKQAKMDADRIKKILRTKGPGRKVLH